MSKKANRIEIDYDTKIVVDKIRYEDGNVYFNLLIHSKNKPLFKCKVVHGLAYIPAPEMIPLSTAMCIGLDRLLQKVKII